MPIFSIYAIYHLFSRREGYCDNALPRAQYMSDVLLYQVSKLTTVLNTTKTVFIAHIFALHWFENTKNNFRLYKYKGLILRDACITSGFFHRRALLN